MVFLSNLLRLLLSIPTVWRKLEKKQKKVRLRAKLFLFSFFRDGYLKGRGCSVEKWVDNLNLRQDRDENETRSVYISIQIKTIFVHFTRLSRRVF